MYQSILEDLRANEVKAVRYVGLRRGQKFLTESGIAEDSESSIVLIECSNNPAEALGLFKSLDESKVSRVYVPFSGIKYAGPRARQKDYSIGSRAGWFIYDEMINEGTWETKLLPDLLIGVKK